MEARLRQFEDVERPAYAAWRRLEHGPALSTLEARLQELRARKVLADRVATLVEIDGWPPREALYIVLHPAECPQVCRDRMDPDEVAARRRSKVDRKRAERKAARRAQRGAETPSAGKTGLDGDGRARRVAAFRTLARRLHPDSPTAIRSLSPSRLGALWSEVLAAYEAGNLERLISIAAWLDSAGDPDPDVVPLLSFAERFERLRALERSARTLERRLAELSHDPAWEFPSRSTAWRRRLRKEVTLVLGNELEMVAAALEEIAAFFEAIGSPRRPRARR